MSVDAELLDFVADQLCLVPYEDVQSEDMWWVQEVAKGVAAYLQGYLVWVQEQLSILQRDAEEFPQEIEYLENELRHGNSKKVLDEVETIFMCIGADRRRSGSVGSYCAMCAREKLRTYYKKNSRVGKIDSMRQHRMLTLLNAL
jgi:hypothetical protein